MSALKEDMEKAKEIIEQEINRLESMHPDYVFTIETESLFTPTGRGVVKVTNVYIKTEIFV